MGNWYDQGTHVSWTYSSDNSSSSYYIPYTAKVGESSTLQTVEFQPATYWDPAKDLAKKTSKKPELAWLDSRVEEITELVPL